MGCVTDAQKYSVLLYSYSSVSRSILFLTRVCLCVVLLVTIGLWQGDLLLLFCGCCTCAATLGRWIFSCILGCFVGGVCNIIIVSWRSCLCFFLRRWFIVSLYNITRYNYDSSFGVSFQNWMRYIAVTFRCLLCGAEMVLLASHLLLCSEASWEIRPMMPASMQ